MKTGIHLLPTLLARLYGPAEFTKRCLSCIRAGGGDAAYVENLLLMERRADSFPRRLCPRPDGELIDEIRLEFADPAIHDRFCISTDGDSHGTT